MRSTTPTPIPTPTQTPTLIPTLIPTQTQNTTIHSSSLASAPPPQPQSVAAAAVVESLTSPSSSFVTINNNNNNSNTFNSSISHQSSPPGTPGNSSPAISLSLSLSSSSPPPALSLSTTTTTTTAAATKVVAVSSGITTPGLSSTPNNNNPNNIPRLDSPYSWPFPPSPHRHHPSSGNSPLPTNTPQWDRLEHENAILKQEISRQQNASGSEISTLKQRLYDLEVENKVLRSLIVGNQESLTEKRSHCQISSSSDGINSNGSPDTPIKHEEEHKKKRFA
ncbi:hypothetical protein F4703DRAFT_1829224 [Phycomyces blakesleeanus]